MGSGSDGIYLTSNSINWHNPNNANQGSLFSFSSSSITSYKSIYPSSDNALYLGDSGHKWNNIYTQNANIASLNVSSSLTIGGVTLTASNGILTISGLVLALNGLTSATALSESSGTGSLIFTGPWSDYTSEKSDYALAASLGYDLHTRVTSLEGKATNVKFTQVIAAGKQIGSISIDGASTNLYAPSTYAWSEITNRPTKLSQFTDDVVSGEYLPLSGGTMTGDINWSRDSHGIYFYNGCGIEKWSNYGPALVAEGNNTNFWIRNGLNRADNHLIFHTGNYTAYTVKKDGTGASGTWEINILGNAATATDADTLDGYHATIGSNRPWGTIPVITPQGWMDVGRHFEFHYDNTTGSDYSTILRCTGNYSNVIDLPFASGTLALTTDNVASSTQSLLLSNTSDAKVALGVYFHGNNGDTSLVGNTEGNGVWGHPSDSQDSRFGNASILRIGWYSKYYTDIFTGPNNARGKYGLQWRQIVNGTSTDWKILLDSSNYNYYAPTLTGTGATGTWGINISGNAATATDADTLDGFHESSFSRHVTGVTLEYNTTKYYKIGSLPASSSSTYDAFLIQGEIGGWPSHEKIVLNICVSRRDSITFSGYTQGLWQNNYGIDIGVNHAGEIVLIVTRNYISWTLDLHTIQGTISYTGNPFTPADTNFVLLSASNNVCKSLTDGTVEKTTKLATAHKIWGRSFDGTGDVSGALSGVTNINSALYINSSGNVGIGTTKDNGSKLQVNGSTFISGINDAAVFTSSNVTSTGVNTTGLFRWGRFDENTGGFKSQFGGDNCEWQIINKDWNRALFIFSSSGRATIAGGITSKADHDFLCRTDEFNFIPDSYSGIIHFNWRTASGSMNGNVTEYRFLNGSGTVYSDIRCNNLYATGNTIQIGSATLTWNGSALVVDKPLVSTSFAAGATATASSSSGSAPTTATAEWYNLRTTSNGRSGLSGAPIVAIENYDDSMASTLSDTSKYRFCLMTLKKHWRIPMLTPRWNPDDGTILKPNTASNIAWDDTWWPVSDKIVAWFSKTGRVLNTVGLGFKKNSHAKFSTTGSKRRYLGCAIFKKTGKGHSGWERVSNIAKIAIFAQAGNNYNIRIVE